jgi:hypothetical protein
MMALGYGMRPSFGVGGSFYGIPRTAIGLGGYGQPAQREVNPMAGGSPLAAMGTGVPMAETGAHGQGGEQKGSLVSGGYSQGVDTGWPQGPAAPAGSLHETQMALRGLLNRTPIGTAMNSPNAQTTLGFISPLGGALPGSSPLGTGAQMGPILLAGLLTRRKARWGASYWVGNY